MARSQITSAAATSLAPRSTWAERLGERWRIFMQRSIALTPLQEITAPVLRHDEVLFPMNHVSVARSALAPLFHRVESVFEQPLVVVIALDEAGAHGVGTLGRVIEGDGETATLIALHRVTIEALPLEPRALVSVRDAPLAGGDVLDDARVTRLRDAAAPLLLQRLGVGDDEEDPRIVARHLQKAPVELAYLVISAAQLPLSRQQEALRIDDAAALLDAAIDVATAFASDGAIQNSTG